MLQQWDATIQSKVLLGKASQKLRHESQNASWKSKDKHGIFMVSVAAEM